MPGLFPPLNAPTLFSPTRTAASHSTPAPYSPLLLAQFLPSSDNLVLHKVIVLALPRMPMQRKTLAFRLRDTREHAHLDNDHSGEDLSNGHDRAVHGGDVS